MDHLQSARESLLEGVQSITADAQIESFMVANINAAIAQAEQLKRMADAAERRNVLLEEYNEEASRNAQRHTEGIAESVSRFVGALYGENDNEQAS